MYPPFPHGVDAFRHHALVGREVCAGSRPLPGAAPPPPGPPSEAQVFSLGAVPPVSQLRPLRQIQGHKGFPVHVSGFCNFSPQPAGLGSTRVVVVRGVRSGSDLRLLHVDVQLSERPSLPRWPGLTPCWGPADLTRPSASRLSGPHGPFGMRRPLGAPSGSLVLPVPLPELREPRPQRPRHTLVPAPPSRPPAPRVLLGKYKRGKKSPLRGQFQKGLCTSQLMCSVTLPGRHGNV